MSCSITKTENGIIIACSRGGGHSKLPPCTFCSRPATKRCDFPIGDGQLCDKRLCGQCARRVGENMDECRIHAIRVDQRPGAPA